MDVTIEPGKYVVAVSGGVDSMVLLDVLRQRKELELIVAHFDHGIRTESADDALFVARKAVEYGLVFEQGNAALGPAASEATAREARYAFLRNAREKYQARAIVTAHHEDDVIETALINLMRGTKHKGVYALRSREDIIRPLLQYTKAEIVRYAEINSIEWREDVTNQDERYLRNYLRTSVLPQLPTDSREKLLEAIKQLQTSGDELELLVRSILATIVKDDVIDRSAFIALGHTAAREVLAEYLRERNCEIDSKLLERLVVDLKTKAAGTRVDIRGGLVFAVERKEIRIERAKEI